MLGTTEKFEIREGVEVGGDAPLLLIAGPCVIEEELDMLLRVAETLRKLCDELGFGYVFKASFDKANRSSVSSYRGVGLERGLQYLAKVKEKIGVPVLTDFHEPWQAEPVSEVVDVLQVPAFLCRQTDMLLAAGRTGKPVNIKKGQFMSPWDMGNAVEKVFSTGNRKVMLTERGFSFGYNNLVVDFRSFPVMASLGVPVVYDVTHSLQLPGGMGKSSGGMREYAYPLARGAVAVGVDALFVETHPEPEKALSDKHTVLPLDFMGKFLRGVKRVATAFSEVLDYESRET